MNIDRVGYHPALAVTYNRHIDSGLVNRDAELPAPAHVRGDLRTMYDVFAGQAGDVVAGASNVFALDQSNSLSLLSRRPGSDFRSRAAAEHYQIVLFRICFVRQLRRTKPFLAHLISLLTGVSVFRQADNPEIYLGSREVLTPLSGFLPI